MANDFFVIRQSLLEWYPRQNNDSVLIINENEGFLKELFEKKCKVTTVEEYDALKSFPEQKSLFDVVVLYDMYGFCVQNDVDICSVIDALLKLISEEGTVFLAMENKLGMKYFAGCQEEQKGGYFVGIEDYSKWKEKIHPLSKKELTDVLSTFAGIDYKFYYPYPDYKYPTIIYTDEQLPEEGELFRNIRNIDRDRYVLFDECAAFNSVIKAGLFPEFSNSYLIKITNGVK